MGENGDWLYNQSIEFSFYQSRLQSGKYWGVSVNRQGWLSRHKSGLFRSKQVYVFIYRPPPPSLWIISDMAVPFFRNARSFLTDNRELHQQTGAFVNIVYNEREEISTCSAATATQSSWKHRATNFGWNLKTVSKQIVTRLPTAPVSPMNCNLRCIWPFGLNCQLKTLTIGQTCCSWLRIVRTPTSWL